MTQAQGFGINSKSLTSVVGIVTLWVAIELATLYQVENIEWWIHFQLLMYGPIMNVVYLAIANYSAGLTGNPSLFSFKPFLVLNLGIVTALFGSFVPEYFHSTKDITAGQVTMSQLTFLGKMTFVNVNEHGRIWFLLISLIGMIIMAVAVGVLLRNIMRARERCLQEIHYISVLKSLELSCGFFIIAMSGDCLNALFWIIGLNVNVAPAATIAFTFGWCSMPIIASLISFVPAMLARQPLPYTETVANRWLPLMGFATMFLIISVVVAMLLAPYPEAKLIISIFIGVPAGLLVLTVFMVLIPLFTAFSFNRPSLVGWLTLIGTSLLFLGAAAIFANGAFNISDDNSFSLSILMYGLRFIVMAFVIYAAESISQVGLHKSPLLPIFQILLLLAVTFTLFLVIQKTIYLNSWIKLLLVAIGAGGLFVPMFIFKLPARLSGEPSSRDVLVHLIQVVLDAPAPIERRYDVRKHPIIIPKQIQDDTKSEAEKAESEDANTLPTQDKSNENKQEWMQLEDL